MEFRLTEASGTSVFYQREFPVYRVISSNFEDFECGQWGDWRSWYVGGERVKAKLCDDEIEGDRAGNFLGYEVWGKIDEKTFRKGGRMLTHSFYRNKKGRYKNKKNVWEITWMDLRNALGSEQEPYNMAYVLTPVFRGKDGEELRPEPESPGVSLRSRLNTALKNCYLDVKIRGKALEEWVEYPDIVLKIPDLIQEDVTVQSKINPETGEPYFVSIGEVRVTVCESGKKNGERANDGMANGEKEDGEREDGGMENGEKENGEKENGEFQTNSCASGKWYFIEISSLTSANEDFVQSAEQVVVAEIMEE